MTKYNYANIEIESGIDVPKKNTQRAKKSPVITLLKKLKIGDSFVLENMNQYTYIVAQSKKQGINLTMRTEDNGTIRVWKVKK